MSPDGGLAVSSLTPHAAATGGVADVMDMVGVLRTVAATRSPDRALSVRYTELRAAMLASRWAPLAPPFLIQCSSAAKFRSFIELFAPDGPRRLEFIEQSFRLFGARHDAPLPRRDIFADEN